jgi:imidazoleglycerol phosphate synthase glutamine amidotransferase subunit HisH
MIGVIDYGAGNLGSVTNALGRLGARAPKTLCAICLKIGWKCKSRAWHNIKYGYNGLELL